jgi:hypothetical protein
MSYGDGGYRGTKAAKAAAEQVNGGSRLSNVLLPPSVSKFRPSGGSWSEHSPGSAGFRRMARDFERYGRTAAAFIRLAMIRIMLRRLANPCHST